ALPVHRHPRRREAGVGERAGRERDQAGDRVHEVVDRGAAIGAEVEPGGGALVAGTREHGAAAAPAHPPPRRPRLPPRHAPPEPAAVAPLAREAMPDGNADRRARGGGAELAAAAGGVSSGHRATLPWSSFSTHGAPGSSRYQWRQPWR